MDAETVTTSVKDRESGERRTVRIDGVEFVRRYLQHAQPPGFHRVRHYGFMHGRSKDKLAAIRELLGVPAVAKATEQSDEPAPAMICPRCGEAMRLVGHRTRAPPHPRSIPAIWARKHPVAA